MTYRVSWEVETGTSSQYREAIVHSTREKDHLIALLGITKGTSEIKSVALAEWEDRLEMPATTKV